MTVSIINESACSSCHANGACTMADVKEKEVEASGFSKTYTAGEEVIVLFRESQGFLALFYGYVLPFIFVFLVLIVSFSLTNNEAVSGLLSLAVLVPYYIVLYFFRHLLKKTFQFEIEENR